MTITNTKQSHAQELQANRAAIEAFLKECVGLGTEGGPKLVQLVSIAPDATETGEAPLAQTFDNVTNAATWAAKQNAKHGVYFQPGEPGKKLGKKLSKRDVRWLPILFADLDPPEGLPQHPASLAEWHGEVVPEIEAILHKHGIAAHIVNTGGGLALFATLEEVFEIITDDDEQYIEDLNARFHALFAGICKVDGTHDCAHLMRLPGTVNYPNKKKRAAGREAALAKWIFDDPSLNTLNIFDALPAVQSPARGNSTGFNYSTVNYSEDYPPWTLDNALDAHAPLEHWQGNGGQDSSGSGACYSLVQTTLESLLKLRACRVSELDSLDARKNVFELCSAFIEKFPERCEDVMAHLDANKRGFDRKLSYDVDRAFSGSDPDRATESVKREKAVETLAAMWNGGAFSDQGPDWATQTHAAVKAALRELALSGVEQNDPMQFERLLDAIGSRASSYGVDLRKKMPGKRETLLDAAYKAEKAALTAERRDAEKGGTTKDRLTQKGDLRLSDFLYLPTKNRYIHTPSGGLWVAEAVDDAVAGEMPSVVLRQTRRVDGVCWDPAEGAVIEGMTVIDNHMVPHKNSFIYNTFKPARVKFGDAGKAAYWTDHVRLLYPNEAEEIFDIHAFAIQNPGVKINFGLFLLGVPGVGKDFLLQPLIYAVGEHNTKVIAPKDIHKDFDEYKQAQLVIINEMTDYGNVSRANPKYALHELLKPLLAAPPKHFTVNPKYGVKTVARNACLVIGMSNHFERSMYLPPEDRRHFVGHTEIEREHFGASKTEQAAFWIERWRWMNEAGRQHVLAFLNDRDVSRFDPGSPPRHTKAWEVIVDFNKSREQAAAEEHQDAHGDWPEAVDISYLLALKTLPDTLQLFFGSDENRNRFGEKMRDCGYLRVENPKQAGGRWRIGGQNVTIFVHKSVPASERETAARKWWTTRKKS